MVGRPPIGKPAVGESSRGLVLSPFVTLTVGRAGPPVLEPGVGEPWVYRSLVDLRRIKRLIIFLGEHGDWVRDQRRITLSPFGGISWLVS